MNAMIATKTGRRKPVEDAVPVKAPGRPPSVAQRQHLFLSEEALIAMAECESVMDAHGPSEVIRVALMHLQNIIVARKYHLRLVAQMPGKERSICGLFDTYVAQPNQKKAHITMTVSAKERLNRCREQTNINSPSGVVVLGLLLLHAYIKAVYAGECVMLVTEDGDPLLGYTPMLSIDRMERAAKAARRAATAAA